jgi:hypothetical protein
VTTASEKRRKRKMRVEGKKEGQWENAENQQERKEEEAAC